MSGKELKGHDFVGVKKKIPGGAFITHYKKGKKNSK